MELSRWEKFNKNQQLLMIGSEFLRAKTWQYKDQEKFFSALERALSLITLTLKDLKWGNNFQMIVELREIAKQFYTSQRTDDASLLYKIL